MKRSGRHEIVERVIGDTGGAFAVGLGYIGDRLGLFKSLAASGPCSSARLASAAGLNERYVREWLKAMVSAGYVERGGDGGDGLYFMTPDQQEVLAQEESPVFAAGAFQFAVPSLGLTERLIECFRRGGGIPYADLGDEIPEAIDRMHRAWFEHHLTTTWLPSEIRLRLENGIRVLDAGCGLGRASMALASKYPSSKVVGVDPHPASIAFAQAWAAEAGLANVEFRALPLEALPASERFDLVLAIDCIHDMRDPAAALEGIRERLTDSGIFFWSEPTGSDDPIENRNPAGKMRAALSPYHCLTVSLAEDGAGLGTLIGEAGARRLAEQAGFKHFEKLPVDSEMQQFFLATP